MDFGLHLCGRMMWLEHKSVYFYCIPWGHNVCVWMEAQNINFRLFMELLCVCVSLRFYLYWQVYMYSTSVLAQFIGYALITICVWVVSERIILLFPSVGSRGQLKCDGTRKQKPDFVFSAKRTSPFKSAGASVHSTTGSRRVRISGSNAGYTMLRGSVKGTGYPFHSPVSPSLAVPCVTVCRHISTGVYRYTCVIL